MERSDSAASEKSRRTRKVRSSPRPTDKTQEGTKRKKNRNKTNKRNGIAKTKPSLLLHAHTYYYCFKEKAGRII